MLPVNTRHTPWLVGQQWFDHVPFKVCQIVSAHRYLVKLSKEAERGYAKNSPMAHYGTVRAELPVVH
jgi:hypothetical protein